MIFGRLPLDQAEGAILAHSHSGASGVLRKGRVLSSEDIAQLRADGVDAVVAARLDAGDVSENEAARQIGAALATDGCHLTEPFTGRVNLVADVAGVLRVEAQAIAAMNLVDEGLTLATLPDYMRVAPGQLIATVKVIPYGTAAVGVSDAVAALREGSVALQPFRGGRAQLVMTKTPGFKDSLLTKGADVVGARVAELGLELAAPTVVPHAEDAVAEVLDATADVILILGASATSDRADVAPAAVVRAGGRIDRFGMPVDPGNLLFLGDLRGVPVVGLPGCARSPALNGVDWVLERIAAGLKVDAASIAAMGVGGLLKEMPGRPQPRQPKPKT